MDLLYTSRYYTSYQDANSRRFYLDLGHKTVEVSFCQLLSLRHKVKQLASARHLKYMLNHSDVALLTLCDKKHLMILDTLQVLDLKELIQRTFDMLTLDTSLKTLISN